MNGSKCRNKAKNGVSYTYRNKCKPYIINHYNRLGSQCPPKCHRGIRCPHIQFQKRNIMLGESIPFPLRGIKPDVWRETLPCLQFAHGKHNLYKDADGGRSGLCSVGRHRRTARSGSMPPPTGIWVACNILILMC